MSVDVTYTLQLDTVEDLGASNVPGAATSGTRKVTHNNYGTSGTLSSTSSVPATKTAYFSQALSTGTATVDLTSLDGVAGTVDFTGLKVQAVILKNPTGNAAITVVPGATNGYNIFGASSSVTLLAGQVHLAYLNEAAPDVSSSVKNIDLSGTGSEELQIGLVAG